ncbi:hypothetical protein K9M48_04195 [Candidatus Gracilibacteria bacterium]|nr:hypothetical protein [Candidatus Gracilibacteria bacterium]
MLNETPTTSTQGMDGQAVGGANPLDLVNEETTKTSNAVQGDGHKSIVDKIIGMIAKLSGNPDPFTGKANISTTPTPEVKVENQSQTPAPEVKAESQSQTPAPEVKAESQTSTASNEEGGLFGKFSVGLTKVLDNVGGKIENLGDKALDGTMNAVTKGLEKAEQVGETAVNEAQKAVVDTTQGVNEFVKLDNNQTENKVETPVPEVKTEKQPEVVVETKQDIPVSEVKEEIQTTPVEVNSDKKPEVVVETSSPIVDINTTPENVDVNKTQGETIPQ